MKDQKNYDVIILGAGSVGTPTAYYLAKEGLSVLVLEKNKAPGRGQNKAAIGGIRATHSDFAKIKLAQRSIDIFSHWKEQTGEDISWKQGGYFYPIYTENDRNNVTELLKKQKSYGLVIDWISRDEACEIAQGVNKTNLLGAIYSPKDGSASPLKSNFSFFDHAKKHSADFKFETSALLITIKNNNTVDVETNTGTYTARWVINSLGMDVNTVHDKTISVPVISDCHEAGITEPVSQLFNPMIVDIRGFPGSKNIYFYQNAEGQIVFCLTPEPPIYCENDQCTSDFLPQFSYRLLQMFPTLGNIRVRRQWRGYYPNTPDGFPIVELIQDSYILLAGMCGQGFMLGPGLAELVRNIIMNRKTVEDEKILSLLSLTRSFNQIEFFK